MKLKILTLIAKGSLGEWVRITVWLSRTLFDLPISGWIVWHRRDAFTGFLIQRRDKKYSTDKLQFVGKYGEMVEIELQLPHVLANDSADSRRLLGIMRHFIASGVKHAADKHAADKRVTQENEYSDFANYPQPTLQTAIVANSLEARLLENPIWGTW